MILKRGFGEIGKDMITCIANSKHLRVYRDDAGPAGPGLVPIERVNKATYEFPASKAPATQAWLKELRKVVRACRAVGPAGRRGQPARRRSLVGYGSWRAGQVTLQGRALAWMPPFTYNAAAYL